MKKRVLQLIGSFNQGGSERQAVGLCRLLVQDGSFDVFAATLNNEGVLRSEIDQLGLPEIPEFPLTSFFNSNFVRQVRSCSKFIKENRIEVVHTHDFYTNVFGMAAASLSGVEARIASKRETDGMRTRGQDLVEKLAFGRAHAIVVNSGSVAEYLKKRGISDSKLKLIYNGLDLSRFDGIGSSRDEFFGKYGLPDDGSRKLVTLVANLRHHVKNVPMLLRAAKLVLEQSDDTHFVIAGEGGLETELREMAAEMGIAGNVAFIGRCTEVQSLLRHSYVGVLTSTAEGFSNSILEYMAAGKPVVATNVGGAGEAIVQNKTGYLVDSNDHRALADHLIDLLNNGEKASAFGAAGRRVAEEKFSESRQLEQTLALYNSLLK